MMPIIVSFGIWNWFIAGVVLLVVELIAPGTFMLWLGLSALAVGAISLAVVWTWQMQFIAFALFSVASIPLWRRFAHRKAAETDQPLLNRRNQSYVGREFVLESPIVGGIGTVRLGDTVWRVTGPDRPSGSRIKVMRADGPTLHVEPVA